MAACQNWWSNWVTPHAARLRFCAVHSVSAECTFCCYAYAPPSHGPPAGQETGLCAGLMRFVRRLCAVHVSSSLMRPAYALCAPLMRHRAKKYAHTRRTRYLVYAWQSGGIGGLPYESRGAFERSLHKLKVCQQKPAEINRKNFGTFLMLFKFLKVKN